jgi:hypothetical protein
MLKSEVALFCEISAAPSVVTRSKPPNQNQQEHFYHYGTYSQQSAERYLLVLWVVVWQQISTELLLVHDRKATQQRPSKPTEYGNRKCH